MTTFTVTLRFQFPAHGDKNGIRYEVRATSKSTAIRYAKVMAERDGHTGGHAVGQGRASFKAVEA
jgi:hypothetical protein